MTILVSHVASDAAPLCQPQGRNFSVAGMLGNHADAAQFAGGSLAIFRLAPQDYHRFHWPVSGTVASITDIPGRLYTVNPIAVNSKVNVFGENKRAVVMIDTEAFGRVAFVAIGATVVGTIHFTAKVATHSMPCLHVSMHKALA